MLNSSFRRYGSASKVVRDALRLLELVVTRRKGESVVLLAMNVTLTPTALNDLRYRLQNDKRQTERVFALCEEIRRTPFDGTGKPEPLRFQLAGCWSRRIDREHRLVYQVEETEIVVIACRYHY